MNTVSIPGIYVSEQHYTLNPLKVDKKCLAAFIGIAEKGPVNKPVLIKSFDNYLSFFGGFDTAGVLPSSVYYYFKCGGAECVITRAAHVESAKGAETILECEHGTATIRAKSSGKWGNYI